MDVCRLYPQYNLTQDRRKQQAPTTAYPYERRSGAERRSGDRVTLDTGLTKDIFEIRNKLTEIKQVAQQKSNTDSFQQSANQKTEKIAFKGSISNAAQNSIKTDTFIKTTIPEFKETPKEAAKSNADAGALGGLLAVVLGGTIASTFLGVAGVGIAVGLGAYFGGKLLRSAISSHLTDKISKK